MTKAQIKKLDRLIGELEAFQRTVKDETGDLQRAKNALNDFRRAAQK
jgi:hypothetical protein